MDMTGMMYRVSRYTDSAGKKRWIIWNVNTWGEDAKELSELLKTGEREESEWLEDSDPGQEYGTTWACFKCGHSLHQPYIWNPYERNWHYCPWCGRKMEE